MSPDTGAVLEAEDIEFSYGRLQVLFGISLRLEAGECLALLGTNGAGKSTLLRILCGLDPPSRGTVRLHGRPVTGEATENLVGQGLVLVAGGRAVFPDMTVAENLEMQSLPIRRNRRLAAERLETVMATFPVLRARIHQAAGSMSGGEQQQLALAKALLLSPAVLCLDELSLGLAPVVVEQLIDMVKGINALGTSVILVEQSLNIASLLCDRAVFLEKGQVSFEGRTVHLMERGDIARAVFLGGTRD